LTGPPISWFSSIAAHFMAFACRLLLTAPRRARPSGYFHQPGLEKPAGNVY
jgi:hypothetical protein